MQHRRICVQRSGYAIVPGNTDEEALENAKKLTASDFDWESVTAELIQDECEVIEVIRPNNEEVQEQED